MVNGDWKTVPLGKVATLQRGYDLPHRQRKRGLVPIVTSSGIGDTHSESRVAGPGVVTGRYGTIGEVFYIQTDFWPLNTTLYVKDFHGNDPLFVSYLLRIIDFHSHSGKSGVPGVNRNDLHEIVVHVPPTKAEQQAIAEALSDADALIDSLEQLIATKSQLKRGAMHELLRPKEGWIRQKLGDISTISTERFDPVSSTAEKQCVELEHLTPETGRLLGHITTRNLRSQKAVFRKGDILFGKLRPYLRKFWHATFDGVCSTELWVMKSNDGIDSGWLYWLVQTDHVVNAANRSTGTKMPRAEWGTVKETEVFVPQTEPEQTDIATILSDMDAEIAALEAKLAKARHLKQGMMQELLTGRIRLAHTPQSGSSSRC